MGKTINNKYKLSDYRVEHSKVFQNDCSVVEYAFLWVPSANAIQNPPCLSDDKLEEIKKILREGGVFDFRISLGNF